MLLKFETGSVKHIYEIEGPIDYGDGRIVIGVGTEGGTTHQFQVLGLSKSGDREWVDQNADLSFIDNRVIAVALNSQKPIPVGWVVFKQKSGPMLRVAFLRPAYLMNDRGDTIEKL